MNTLQAPTHVATVLAQLLERLDASAQPVDARLSQMLSDDSVDWRRTASKLLEEYSHLRKRFWGRHLWARGYFLCDGRADDRRDDQAVLGAPL